MPLKHFLVIQPLKKDPLDQQLPRGDATVTLDTSTSMVSMSEPEDIQHGEFKKGDTPIGRKHGDIVQPTARSVSGTHCKISVNADEATFHDLGSSFESKVGGDQVVKNASRPLANGDEIILPNHPEVSVYFVATYVTEETEESGDDPSQTQVDDRPTTVE